MRMILSSDIIMIIISIYSIKMTSFYSLQKDLVISNFQAMSNHIK